MSILRNDSTLSMCEKRFRFTSFPYREASSDMHNWINQYRIMLKHIQVLIFLQAFNHQFLISLHIQLSSMFQTLNTVFCWINTPAWLNAPPTFDFDWLHLKIYLIDRSESYFSTVEVFRSPHCDFHRNQTRVRVRFCLRALRVYSAKYGNLFQAFGPSVIDGREINSIILWLGQWNGPGG